jgi:putative spermidine/putrescine transport system substrate-binding protein
VKITTALIALASSTIISLPAFADPITFITDGGAYVEAQKKALIDPAAARLGLQINAEGADNMIASIKAQIESKNVYWDVVEVGPDDCVDGTAQGLFEALDYGKIPNAKDLPADFRKPTYLGYIGYSSVLAWNKKKYGENGPKTWADFWDVKKFPGRRSLRGKAYVTLEMALLADGVPKDKLYPLDVDRAYKKLEEIKPNVTAWWSSGAQSAQLIADGEVDMIGIWNGRVAGAIKANPDIGYTFNQGIYQNTCLVIPKGSKHKDEALKVINEILSPDLQADIPKYISYGPANPKAYTLGKISDELKATLPSAPENYDKQVLIGAAWWASPDGVKATERWLNFVQQ